jgi:hypothetical protein
MRNQILNHGHPYVKNKKFYGVFNSGEWAYYDPTNPAKPWKFMGGIVAIVSLERQNKIDWYILTLPSGRELYLPKYEGKKLIFVYDRPSIPASS